MIKKIMIIILLVISVNNVSANITNGGFETGDVTGWTVDGFYAYSHFKCSGAYSARTTYNLKTISQTTDFSGFGTLNFSYSQWGTSSPSQDRFYVYIDTDLIATITDRTGTSCKTASIDVSGYSGNHILKFENNNIDGSNIHLYLDDIILQDYVEPTYITLNFKDNCGNLLRNTELQYCNHVNELITCYLKNTSTGSYDILFKDQDYLELWVNSAMGTLYYNITNPQDDINYTILNPVISWNNNIMVVDGNTSTLIPISGALIMFFQECIINPSVYPSRNKFSDSNGFANFEQCELNSFSLAVSADGYKSYSGSISASAMDAFILSQTVMIKLYPISEEGNESEYNYTDYATNIYFKDVNGNYTTSILDTDNYVDLYYYNNNSNGTAMTLKFQKYNIETGTIDLLSWNIPIDTDGYYRILKSNYTDMSYLYIGYLYNYAIDGWDRIEYLSVRNETSEIDLDYQNLTAFTWFVNKNPEGSIDYRETIEIIAYANTTYVGLFNISLELYDNTTYIDHINLTWADFIGADLKYFYEWNPLYSYVNGHNYTVRMHGYDYYLLDMDYVNATDYRKNKLTILVKDQLGNNLVNSFVFLDNYGSLSTGIGHFNSYENLEDGYYRYRASKSGYEASGWDDITLSGTDEIVTYVLTISTDADATRPIKTSDNELKNLYIMLMAFLLIFILFGGFMYVIK